jgi:hypothetical protein
MVSCRFVIMVLPLVKRFEISFSEDPVHSYW